MATAYKIKPRVSIERKEEGIVVKFPYNPDYIAKIKTIEGYRWHPDKKYWSFPDFASQKLLLCWNRYPQLLVLDLSMI